MIIRKMAKKICQKMLGVNILAAVIVCSSSANGAISVTASRDYVDRKISVVSNQLERIESRTNDWNSAIQGITVNGGEPIEATDNIVDISVPVAGTSLPLIADIADAGTSNEYSRVDHTHPAETKVAAYALPDECFPITYTVDGTGYSISSNAELSYDVSTFYISVLDVANAKRIASFDKDPPYVYQTVGGTNIEALKFNGVAPVASTSPTLRDDAVYVRDVQVAKEADVAAKLALKANDAEVLKNSGDQTLQNGTLTAGAFKVPNAQGGYIQLAAEVTSTYFLFSPDGQTVYRIEIPEDSGTLALLSQVYAAVQQIAPAWSKPASGQTGTAYTNGISLCTYDGVLYQCANTYTTDSNSNPPPNDIYDSQHTSRHWVVKKVSELFLPLTGGTMTGNLEFMDLSSYRHVWKFENGIGGDLFLDTYNSSNVKVGSISIPSCVSGTLALLQNLAPNFSTSATYAVNDLCIYNYALYRCTNEVTTASTWTGSTNWTEATVEDVLSAFKESLGDTIKGVKINGNDVQVTNQVANIAMNTVDIDGSIETQYPEVSVKSGLSAGHSYTFTHQTTTAANQRYTRAGFSMNLLDYMDSGGADSTYFQSYATINKLAMYLSRASNINARLLVRERGSSTDLFSSDEFTISNSLSLVTITFPAEAKFDLDKRYDFWFVQSGTSNILDNVSIYTEVNYAVPNFEIMSANGTRYSLNNECFRGNSIIKVGYDIDIAKKSDVSNIDAYIDDLSRCYIEWKEPLADNSQSGGSNQIFITPSAFGATTNCTIRSIVIKTSNNAGQIPQRIVYAKLRDNSTGNTLCVSRPVYIGSAGVEYKFIFDGEFSLAHNKQYRIDFESALNNAVNVAVRLSDEQTENQGIYYGSYLKRRPIIKVLYSDATFTERYYTKEEVDIAVSTATPSDYDAVKGQVNTNTANIATNAANITAQWQACTEAFADRYYTEISTNSTTGVVSTNNYGALYGSANMLTGNVEFVSAVKSVPITPDPADAEELSEYGTYGSVGAAILGLIAATAALKRKKLDGDSAAPAWVSGTAYTQKALVTYDGVIYQNTSGSTIQSATPPSNSGSGWTAKKVSELKLDSEAAAPDYDSTATYAEGEYVTYLGKLYRCTTAIDTAEDWAPAHWTEVTIDEILGDKAPLASPAFSGRPTAPNMDAQSTDGQVANKKYVDEQVAGATPSDYNAVKAQVAANAQKLEVWLSVNPQTGVVSANYDDGQSAE